MHYIQFVACKWSKVETMNGISAEVKVGYMLVKNGMSVGEVVGYLLV